MLTWRDQLSTVQTDPEERLRAQNAARDLRRAGRRQGVKALRLLTPEQRFGEVIDALAAERGQAGVHISEVAELFGSKFPTRGAGYASVREVAAALRTKGWRRVRGWRGALGSYETKWFPPEETA